MNNVTFCYVFNNDGTKSLSHAPVLMEITKQLAKTFSGQALAFIHDFFPDVSVKDFHEIHKKFFKNSIGLVEKKPRTTLYGKTTADLIKQKKITQKNKSELRDIIKPNITHSQQNFYLHGRQAHNFCIDDLLNGPIFANIPLYKTNIPVFIGKSTNIGSYNYAYTNVIDYQDQDISFVIKDIAQKEQTIEEILICSELGIIPPYYLHFKFDSNFPSNMYHLCSSIEVLEAAVHEIAVNLNFPVDMTFKFLNNYLSVGKSKSHNDNTKSWTKEDILSTFPGVNDEKINAALALCNAANSNCDKVDKRKISDIIINPPIYLDEVFNQFSLEDYNNIQIFLTTFHVSNNIPELLELTHKFCAKRNLPLDPFNALVSYALTGYWGLESIINWQKIAVKLKYDQIKTRIMMFLTKLAHKLQLDYLY